MTLGMGNQTALPAATFKALFQELIAWSCIYALLRRCGVRRRCPPVITAVELIQGLVFYVVAEAGTLAQHVTQLTGKSITDGALAQRRAATHCGVRGIDQCSSQIRPDIRKRSIMGWGSAG